jgi:signal transduction histidine kinase
MTLAVNSPLPAKAAPDAAQPPGSPRRPLALLFAAVLVMVWAGTAWRISQERREIVHREELRTATLARAFAEHTLASFRRLDSLLITLRHRWAEDPRSFAAEVRRQSASLADISINVTVAGRDGRMEFNSLETSVAPVYIGDREHFVVQQEAHGDRLFISTPIKARVSGRWSVFLSRQLPSPDGRFAGVAIVAVDPGHFARFYESLDLGDDGVIAMVRDDGQFLSRYPGLEVAMVTKLSGAPFLEPGSAVTGNFRRIGQTDGIERIYGYQRLPEFGMSVTVGQSLATALAPARTQALLAVAAATAISALLALLAISIHRGFVAREAAEEATRRHAKDLERRVAERTAQLTAANRELEGFAYSVAHDLKAPLRGIDGFSALLLEEHAGQLDEGGRRYLQRVRVAALRMNELIDGLLQYARIERRDSVAEPVDLAALAHRLVAEHAEEITARGVLVAIALPSAPVRADAEGLAIALRNLIGNALKFTAGVPLPALEIDAQAQEGSWVLRVRDNGVGFDMQYHDRIFTMFQRLHRAEDYPGTGVGLALVKKSIERMGGRVWADSEPGKGATFYLAFPCAPA